MVTILGVKKYLKFRAFRSLRFRITILMILAGLVPGVLLKMVLLKSYELQAVEVRTAQIQNQCTILCDQLSTQDYLQGVSSEVIKSELTQISNIYSGRIMVIDEHYHISEDTYNMDTGKLIVSENVNRCFAGDETTYYDAENRYLEVTAPIQEQKSKDVRGVLLVSISTDEVADTIAVMDWKATVVLAVVELVLAILAVFSGVIMVRPFKRITQTIDEVSDGYGEFDLHENTYTETKRLSATLNKTIGRMKELDDSRQEFVANVSHELKTPLTSMKVLADSLLGQEGAPVELYQEFMGDISEEIERENKIINDLLALVKMDKAAGNMNIAVVNINDLIERILKRLQPIAEQRKIEIVFESFRIVQAEVDATKFSLVVTNLVENAIKYNREEGWVHVSLDADLKFFWVVVSDSGIGIPEKDRVHIFERFYRVDKSHSREIGGTGLGLSIARNAVIMHRGAIKCSSEEGEGTTFTVRIPLNYIV